MKSSLGLSLTYSVLGITFIAYCLYLTELLPFGYVNCIFAVTFQLVLFLVVWKEIDHLADFHLDWLTMIIVVLFGSIFRKRTDVPYEIFFQILQWVLSLLLLWLIIQNRSKIPVTKIRWGFVGIVIALIAVVPFAYLINITKYVVPPQQELPYPVGSIVYILGKVFQQFTYVSPIEEIIFRGLLIGYWVRSGWSTKKAFWGQAIFFWAIHLPSLFILPVPLHIILPIDILIFTLLVWLSKQIFPSIIAHTILNVFQPVVEFLINY